MKETKVRILKKVAEEQRVAKEELVSGMMGKILRGDISPISTDDWKTTWANAIAQFFANEHSALDRKEW